MSRHATTEPSTDNPAAVALGNLRWRGYTKAEMSAHFKKLRQIPRKKKVVDERS